MWLLILLPAISAARYPIHKSGLPEPRTLAHCYMDHYHASPQRLHLALGNRRSRQRHIANLLGRGVFDPGSPGLADDQKRTFRDQSRCRRGVSKCRPLGETSHSQVVCDFLVAAGHGRVACANLRNAFQTSRKPCRGICLRPYRHLRSRVPAGAKYDWISKSKHRNA